MRKLVVTEFLSLDGVMQDPHEWSFDYPSDEQNKYKLDETFASDALLLGRVTYEAFAVAWPEMTDEVGFADRFNSMPKYVVSTTLENAEWNNSSIISENVAGEIRNLKEQPGQDIAIHGSGNLIQTLIKEDLIDEYRLMIFPVVLGKGQRLFPEGSNVKLKLVDTTEPFSSGVMVLTYEPDRSD